MSESGFAWKRRARGGAHTPPPPHATITLMPALCQPGRCAGTSRPSRHGGCSLPVDQKLHLLARFSPAASVCLPRPGGCGLSSVVSLQDFGFSRDVSSLSRNACLLHVYKNIEDEYITFKISHHWAVLSGCGKLGYTRYFNSLWVADVTKASPLRSNAAPGPRPGNPGSRTGGVFPKEGSSWEGTGEEAGHREVPVFANQHHSQSGCWAGWGLSAARAVENKTLSAILKSSFY